MTFNVQAVDKTIQPRLEHKVNFKTKPVGSLGKLEKLAIQIGMIQQTQEPTLCNPHILIFAGDHGVANSGVSAFPQEVTHQMVMNFLGGGAAINVFARQNGMEIKVIDAGVNFDFHSSEDLVDQKIRKSTSNYLEEPAMTLEELNRCFSFGSQIVDKILSSGCNVVGFGEMGIGNTSSASLIMSQICELDIEDCVGRGTGVDDDQLKRKIQILNEAANKYGQDLSPLEVIQTFGGFEIAQMCGAMLRAAEKKMVLLIDGFIATASFLVAQAMHPEIIDYAISCHVSEESGHKRMLEYLNIDPIMNLNMRLGEGTGAAVAYPIVSSSVSFLNQMASFEEAGVSNKE